MFFIVPIVETFYYSFTRWKGIGKEQWIGIDNYIKMFTRDAKFGMEVSNTFVYVLGSVPLTLIVAVIFAAMMNSKIKAVGFFRDDGHRCGDDLALAAELAVRNCRHHPGRAVWHTSRMDDGPEPHHAQYVHDFRMVGYGLLYRDPAVRVAGHIPDVL